MIQRNSLFVDTAGWADPILQNTIHHENMRTFSQHVLASLRPLVTTNYVMNELVALLTSRSELTRQQIIAFVNNIKRMAQLHIVHIDVALDHQAWMMLEQYQDKNWSPVDAASFVVMQHLQINEAFTSDHHFTQAGFVRLPTTPS